jgi:hypothetical protein
MGEEMSDNSEDRIELGNPKQIGAIVKDARRSASLLSSLTGVGPFRFLEWPSDRPDMTSFHRGREGNFRLLEGFANFGNIEIELIEPIAPYYVRGRGSRKDHFSVQ